MCYCNRPKAIFQELTKQQPFARSVSTAAEMVKRRQALADLEMVPCTFHPALDPHSLALVATMVSQVLQCKFHKVAYKFTVNRPGCQIC